MFLFQSIDSSGISHISSFLSLFSFTFYGLQKFQSILWFSLQASYAFRLSSLWSWMTSRWILGGSFLFFSFKDFRPLDLHGCCSPSVSWLYTLFLSPGKFTICSVGKSFANWFSLQFVFLIRENLTLIYAIFHPTSGFHIRIITLFSPRLLRTWSVGRKISSRPPNTFPIQVKFYCLTLSEQSLALYGWGHNTTEQYIYIYIYICVCVCVCVYALKRTKCSYKRFPIVDP